MFRISVLISGNGSNLQALIDAISHERLPLAIVHVISNRPDAFGLQRANRAGIRTSVLDHTAYRERTDFDRALAGLIAKHPSDLVMLAGFMRILGPEFLDRCPCSVINLHPSLLPRHRGTDTCRRAIEAGDTEHGSSIHFVTRELDGGPVISQVRVPIRAGDDAQSLMARLAPREHQLVVATMELFCAGRVQKSGHDVLIDGLPIAQPLLLDEHEIFAI